jgi:hypothetical protein
MPLTSPNSARPNESPDAPSAYCCAACGTPIAGTLSRLGSVRCHDCRDSDAPILSQAQSETSPRELAYRSGSGLEVSLLWFEAKRCVTVRVFDSRTGDRFEIPVEPEDALTAFRHPFAYVRPRRRARSRSCTAKERV